MRCHSSQSRWAVLILGLGLCACEAPPEPEPGASPPDDRDLATIQAWLAAGEYLDWERHDPPPGPDMSGGSRVYLSPELAASLRSGAPAHPVGSAAVREIVDPEGASGLLGFAYLHKLEAEAGPEGWLFYEVFDVTAEAAPLVAERGSTGCVGCHEDGVDFVRSILDAGP